jgi:hypothetical protein
MSTDSAVRQSATRNKDRNESTGQIELFSHMSRKSLRRELRKRQIIIKDEILPDDSDKLVQMLLLWEWENWLKANPTFHRFSQFPPEIQLMIFQLWENKGPRLIHMIIGGEAGRPVSFRREFEVGLQLCQLSRASITAKAREVFGVSGLYANLERDALLIDGWDIFTNLRLLMPKNPVNQHEIARKADMRRKVQHIVLPFDFMDEGFRLHPELSGMLVSRGLRLFLGLKTLSFVYGPKEYLVDVLGPRRICLAPQPIDEEKIDDPWFIDVLKRIRR